MRHGPAEDDAPSGRDFDRRLTVKGRERTERVARALAQRTELPRRLLCSPLVRTVQTAEVISAVLALGIEVEHRAELAPGGDALQLSREWSTEPGPLMLVGHEPDLTVLTMQLCPTWSGRYNKSMVVALTIAAASSSDTSVAAQVDFTIDPKQRGN